jgi:3-oxoacyl-[acyl-carrier protein] reductase
MSGNGRLYGRAALVTGASRGIGAAVVRAFAEEGAAVALGHEPQELMSEMATQLAQELRKRGKTAVTVPGDLSAPEVPAKMVVATQRALGRVDILVANAAVTRQSPWNATSVAFWDYTQAVNVPSTWLLVQAAYEDLKRSRGSVITVTSVMAQTGQPGALSYTTSKAAVIGMTRALARELGPDGIRVNAVMPGAIRTEQEVEITPDEKESAHRFIPLQALQRRGRAEDLAGAFVFLASDESAFVTGQVVTVDGGWVMR